MFDKTVAAWNTRTPDYLHPNTPENIVWQLKLLAVMLVGYEVGNQIRDRVQDRRRRNNTPDPA